MFMKARPQPLPQRTARLTWPALLLLSTTLALAAATPEELLKGGDAMEAKLDTQGALVCYLAAEKDQPKNPDLLIRIARQYRHLMGEATTVSDKMRLGNLALAYSNRAAALAPRSSDAVLAPAITYGRLVKYLPKKDQVTASKVIKVGAERAVVLDPRNDLAWHVLGRWHRVASDVGTVKRALAGMLYEGLPPSSIDDSAKYLETAVKLNPHRVMHHIELGKTYAQMGRKEDARRSLNKGLSLPAREKEDPALKQSGRETLSTL